MQDGRSEQREDADLRECAHPIRARGTASPHPVWSRPWVCDRPISVPGVLGTGSGRLCNNPLQFSERSLEIALLRTDPGEAGTSYASLLANYPVRRGDFMIDYSVDPASVPRIPAAAIFSGHFDPRQIAGKDVIAAVTSAAGSDIVFIPGSGPMGGAYVHILGAETLKSGVPASLGWFPLFLVGSDDEWPRSLSTNFSSSGIDLCTDCSLAALWTSASGCLSCLSGRNSSAICDCYGQLDLHLASLPPARAREPITNLPNLTALRMNPMVGNRHSSPLACTTTKKSLPHCHRAASASLSSRLSPG